MSKKLAISVDGKPEDKSTGTQRGVRGMCLGFSPTQNQTDCHIWWIGDTCFALTVAETWRPFRSASALRPTASFTPDPYIVTEHTGCLLSQFEERNTTANNNQTMTSPYEEDIIQSDLISDLVANAFNDANEESSEEEATEGLEDSNEEADSSDIVPQIIVDELDSNT
jgi:hypothetical protein